MPAGQAGLTYHAETCAGKRPPLRRSRVDNNKNNNNLIILEMKEAIVF